MGKTWVFPAQAIVTNCRNASLFSGATGGTVLGGVCVTGANQEYTLAAGEYRIEVVSYNSQTGTYSLYPYEKSPAEVFAYQLGQTVADGTIGGVATVPIWRPPDWTETGAPPAATWTSSGPLAEMAWVEPGWMSPRKTGEPESRPFTSWYAWT